MDTVFTLEQIHNTAAQLWQEAKQHKVWAFNGDMGAGKTTFIHALCEVLQVTGAVSSPTFAIINEYKSPVTGSIFHMDWYRLKDEEEAIQAGVEDCLYSGSLCLVEWPQKAEGLLPADTLQVHIILVNGGMRRIKTSL
jgi:tRNA threonylcarbamoyladenosine biosynthesis protein TsaE